MDRKREEFYAELQLSTEDIVLETVEMLKKRYNSTMRKVLDVISLWWMHNEIENLTDAQTHMDELMRELDGVLDPSYTEYVSEMTALFAEVYAFNAYYAQQELEIEEEESEDDLLLLFTVLGLSSIAWVEDGITYEERMLMRNQQLKDNIRQIVLRGAARGLGTKRIVKMVQDEMKKSKYRGVQIIVDEANHFANEGVKQIADDKFEGYEISEVLDAKTCGWCASMNGKRFTWDKYEVGISAPRFHPCCRGRIVPIDRKS